MKKTRILLLVLLLFALYGCSDMDITDKIISENSEELYLVTFGEQFAGEVEISNLTLSKNQIEETKSNKKYKLILISKDYIERIDSDKANELKEYVIKNGFWILIHSNDIEVVKDFASKFGKAINPTEHSNIYGFILHYDDQKYFNGTPAYITEPKNNNKAKSINNLVKMTYRDMIELRYSEEKH